MKPPKMPEPPGAYGPTQYPFIGMNCSFCAEAAVTTPASARPSRAALTAFRTILIGKSLSRSETKRNETKRNETKRNETKQNETKRHETNAAFATKARMSMMHANPG